MFSFSRTASALWQGRLAVDPGLLRLRLAARATLAVAVSSAVLHEVGPAVGMSAIVAMLIGGMVGMIGSFASSSRGRRDTLVTLSALPLAAAAGATPAALLAGHSLLHLAGFVPVMVAAVFVRQFGPRWFNYGMLVWLSYFFATFVGTTARQLPALLAVIVCATASLIVVAAGLLPDRPTRTRVLVHRSFVLRIRALAATAHDVAAGQVLPGLDERRLQERSYRLLEVALILDGYLAGTDTRTAATGRRVLLESELAAEELAATVARLPVEQLHPGVRLALIEALQALSTGDGQSAREAASRLGEVQAEQGDIGDTLSSAVTAMERLARLLDGPELEPPAHIETYTPAVDLYLGQLPGSASSVLDVVAGSRLPWSLNTRLCVQTAVAAPIALTLGQLLSPQRYYWAVLACFLALTGTLTTGEATTKGVNRVLGTLAGLGTATVAVHVTGSDDTSIVAVMLLCVFLGLYFFRVSYALMTFAVTTVMGELYNVLHEFTDQLLLLRLVETAVGAAVTIAVVLVVLPVHSSAARQAAQAGLLRQLAELLADLRDRLSLSGKHSDLLYDARLVDAKLHQLALVSRPAAGPMLIGVSTRSGRAALADWTAVAYTARSFALAVALAEPGTHPQLGLECELLRQRCLGEGPDRHLSDEGTELHRRFSTLARAVSAVLPAAARDAEDLAREPVAHPQRAGR